MDESNNDEVEGMGAGRMELEKRRRIRANAMAEAWAFKKSHIISELSMIEKSLIVIRNILDGSRTPCERCEDKKWINEKEGRLKMELGGLISKVNRVSKRASKVK